MRSAHLNSTLQWRRPCEKTQGLVRFLTSKHHFDTAIPLRSAATALQIAKELRRQRLQTCTWNSHYNTICLNSTLQWRTRPRSNPWRSDPSVPPIHAGSHLARENTGFGAILNVQKTHWRSNSTAICDHHCLANHKRTTSTKTTNIHMKQPFQCDLHTWILLYSGCVRDQIREGRTPRGWEPLCARKHRVSCDSHVQTSPWHSSSTAICSHSLANDNRTICVLNLSASLSHLYSLRISTLHISTLFASLLFPHLYSLHVPTLSHLYSLHSHLYSRYSPHLYSLHIPTLSHLYSLHVSTLSTSVLSHISTLSTLSHLYSLHISTLFASLLFPHLDFLQILKIRTTEFRRLNILWWHLKKPSLSTG